MLQVNKNIQILELNTIYLSNFNQIVGQTDWFFLRKSNKKNTDNMALTCGLPYPI